VFFADTHSRPGMCVTYTLQYDHVDTDIFCRKIEAIRLRKPLPYFINNQTKAKIILQESSRTYKPTKER